jgi:hypothetical protein
MPAGTPPGLLPFFEQAQQMFPGLDQFGQREAAYKLREQQQATQRQSLQDLNDQALDRWHAEQSQAGRGVGNGPNLQYQRAAQSQPQQPPYAAPRFTAGQAEALPPQDTGTPYGAWAGGDPGGRGMDFIDRDRDGADDRKQPGPGQSMYPHFSRSPQAQAAYDPQQVERRKYLEATQRHQNAHTLAAAQAGRLRR